MFKKVVKYLIKKRLADNFHPSAYVISTQQTSAYQFIFEDKKGTIDITNQFQLFNFFPPVIGVLKNERYLDDTAQITVSKNGKAFSTLDLIKHPEQLADHSSIQLFTVKKTMFDMLSSSDRLQLKYWSLNSNYNLPLQCVFLNSYLIPRPVYLGAITYNDHSNTFPLDLILLKDNFVYWAISKSNASIKIILEARKFVLSDSGELSIEEIYNLGRNHSQTNTEKVKLKRSKHFDYNICKTANVVYEVEVLTHHLLGSHYLLSGEIKYQYQEMIMGKSRFYHVHSLS